MKRVIIAAMAANRVIGHRNTLPWHIPEDLAHFKAVTMGHSLIMGRHTFASIGHPLPGRQNIVLSRAEGWHLPPEVQRAASIPQALALCPEERIIFFIGGVQVFQAALPLVDTLLLSRIEQHFTGDVFFPDFSTQPFSLVNRVPLPSHLPVFLETYQRDLAECKPAPALCSP